MAKRKEEPSYINNSVGQSHQSHIESHLMRLLQYLSHKPEGARWQELQRVVGKSRATVFRYLKRLKELGMVTNRDGLWFITENGLTAVSRGSLPTRRGRPGICHHAILKFRILDDNPNFEWDEEQFLRHTRLYYKRLENIRVTLKKGKNHIMAYLWRKNVRDPQEVISYIFRIAFMLFAYLYKNGIAIDPLSIEIIDMHISFEDPTEVVDNFYPRNMRVEVNLNRKALLTEKEARAWIDKSPFLGVETNCPEYWRNFLVMPERIKDIQKKLVDFMSCIDLYNKNIQLHLQVLQEIRDAIKELKEIIRSMATM